MRPRPRALLRHGIGVLIGVALAAGSIIGYGYWWLSETTAPLRTPAKKRVIADLRPELGVAPVTPEQGSAVEGVQTFLLIGDDRRAGQVGRGNTDTMILARIDADAGWVSLLSVPRDLLVPIPGYGSNRVNAAYAAGGARLLIRTLRDYLHVRIDHVAIVSFKGFSDMVSAIGGVYLPIDARYHHRNDGTAANNFANIDLQPGYQRVGREQALAWVRYRHTDNDFYRAARQQVFLREVKRQVAHEADDRLVDLVRLGARATTTDVNSPASLLGLARFGTGLASSRIYRFTLPGADQTIGGAAVLVANDADRTRVVRRWVDPTRRQPRHPVGPGQVRPSPQSAQLLADQAPPAPGAFEPCRPRTRPAAYRWGPVRAYRLAGKPAVARVLSGGSGRSLLWMHTAWTDPPIVAEPSDTLQTSRGEVRVYREGKVVRQIARREAQGWTWLTNTLTNEFSATEMRAMLDACGPVGRGA